MKEGLTCFFQRSHYESIVVRATLYTYHSTHQLPVNISNLEYQDNVTGLFEDENKSIFDRNLPQARKSWEFFCIGEVICARRQ